MIIYNITFQVDFNESQVFVVYLHDVYVPAIEKAEGLSRPRLCRILSHRDADTECFSLQFECESTAVLHKWYAHEGKRLNEDMKKMFADRVIGFPTMLEEIL